MNSSKVSVFAIFSNYRRNWRAAQCSFYIFALYTQSARFFGAPYSHFEYLLNIHFEYLPKYTLCFNTFYQTLLLQTYLLNHLLTTFPFLIIRLHMSNVCCLNQITLEIVENYLELLKFQSKQQCVGDFFMNFQWIFFENRTKKWWKKISNYCRPLFILLTSLDCDTHSLTSWTECLHSNNVTSDD